MRTVLNVTGFDINTKMRKFSNGAMMTGDWKHAVKQFRLKEDHIVIFNFKPKPTRGLNLRLRKLPLE